MPIFELPNSAGLSSSIRYVKEMGVSSEPCSRCGEMAVMQVRWLEMRAPSLVQGDVRNSPAKALVTGAAIVRVEYVLCFACLQHNIRTLRADGTWGDCLPALDGLHLSSQVISGIDIGANP